MQQVEIRIKGQIDEHWSDWFGELTIVHVEPDETVLSGAVTDQAALYGLLARLRDLGLSLVSVKSNFIELPERTFVVQPNEHQVSHDDGAPTKRV